MYLKECRIENVGPIEMLDIQLPFNDDGNPKPLIIVGRNGAGKSILLSYVVDALIEFAKKSFSNIVPITATGTSPYFKLVSPVNQRLYSEYGICLLKFDDQKKAFSYLEKTGNFEYNKYVSQYKERFPGLPRWSEEENYKEVFCAAEKDLESIFKSDAICYFPSNRSELPHWLNIDSLLYEKIPEDKLKIQGVLDKPIVVSTSNLENKQWILDLFLDSMVDIISTDSGVELVGEKNLSNKFLLRRGRENIEKILKNIIRSNDAILNLNRRGFSSYRLSVTDKDKMLIPSLDSLSSGQSILFNLFCTIVRYADKGDINKSIGISDIKGIVIVDEIDAHLDSDLQYEVLPNLMKLFPKIQFIVSTHAPLFMLGMEQQYGREGIEIIEMPSGNTITTERFSEFHKSFDYYKQTKAFEDDLENKIINSSKPKVLTEGDTDSKYIITCLELSGHADILNELDIDWVGMLKGTNAINTGDTALNNARNFYEANPGLLKSKLLLLYDCDTNKPAEDIGNLSLRSIPKNDDNTLITKGIENLLPPELFERRFYSEKVDHDGYGAKNVISKLNKRALCDWICDERKDPKDFVNFDNVINIIFEFLGISNGELDINRNDV